MAADQPGSAGFTAPVQVRADLLRRLRGLGRPMRTDDVHVVDPPKLKRAVTASALGNCMEWFDFGIYSYLAVTIGKVFYPDASPTAQLLSSFATFAAAFVVRPLGGLFFGPLGDRIGRKRVLAATMILMAAGTFAVGFIPGYDTIGVAAPLLLLLARMVQGFSTGGEYGGATTFVAEYAPDRRRGFIGSWLDFGTFVGYSLGSLLVTLLNVLLTDAEMLSWGWRIPFWLAGPLGIIGLYMRLKLEDSPAFEQQLDDQGQAVSASDRAEKAEKAGKSEQPRHEFRTILRDHRPGLLVCVGLVLLYNVTNYMVTGYLPSYQDTELGRSATTSNLLVLAGMLWVVLFITWFGRLSDRIGRKPLFRAAAVGQIVLALPAFLLIRADGWQLPLLGVLLLSTVLAMLAGPSAATLPALFPTAIRYAAMGIGFNFSVAAFGGTTPLFTEALVDFTGNELVPGFYLMASGLIGLVAVHFMPETAQVPLSGSQPMVDSIREARSLVTAARQLLTPPGVETPAPEPGGAA